MTPELVVLARRAVESHRWRWMPGMLRVDGYRACHRTVPRALNPAEDMPDLDDAATVGCVLALYEESRTMLTCPDPVYTYVSAFGLFHTFTLEKLVSTLEAVDAI